MPDLFRTLVAPNGQIVSLRQKAKDLDEASYGNCFETPLNKTGTGNPTHWISSGYCDPDWLAAFEAATNPSVDISEEDPFVALERLDLKIINPPAQ